MYSSHVDDTSQERSFFMLLGANVMGDCCADMRLRLSWAVPSKPRRIRQKGLARAITSLFHRSMPQSRRRV